MTSAGSISLKHLVHLREHLSALGRIEFVHRLIDQAVEFLVLLADAPQIIAAEFGLVAVVGVVGILRGHRERIGQARAGIADQHLELPLAEGRREFARDQFEIEAGFLGAGLQASARPGAPHRTD